MASASTLYLHTIQVAVAKEPAKKSFCIASLINRGKGGGSGGGHGGVGGVKKEKKKGTGNSNRKIPLQHMPMDNNKKQLNSLITEATYS